MGIDIKTNGKEGYEVYAIEDGFIPGETLFPIEKAVDNGSIIMFLLSDAGQIDIYPKIRDKLDNKTLYFSHGFGVVYRDQTNIDVNNLNLTFYAFKSRRCTNRHGIRTYRRSVYHTKWRG